MVCQMSNGISNVYAAWEHVIWICLTDLHAKSYCSVQLHQITYHMKTFLSIRTQFFYSDSLILLLTTQCLVDQQIPILERLPSLGWCMPSRDQCSANVKLNYRTDWYFKRICFYWIGLPVSYIIFNNWCTLFYALPKMRYW